MRISVLSGLFSCAVIVAVNSSPTNVEALTFTSEADQSSTIIKVDVLEPLAIRPVAKTDDQPPAPPAQVVHEVISTDSLSSIAEKHKTTWVRIFNKNEQVADPDIITVGTKLIIPTAHEQLNERPLPAPEPVVEPQPTATTAAAPVAKKKVATQKASPPAEARRGASGGNTYTPGYCTWYAKNMRPDLPNNLGNADTWVSRAAAQGIPTGSTPRVGAIGQQGMHVVYVERVNGDGTVFISEMNYQGRGVTSTRTVPASNFKYIY